MTLLASLAHKRDSGRPGPPLQPDSGTAPRAAQRTRGPAHETSRTSTVSPAGRCRAHRGRRPRGRIGRSAALPRGCSWLVDAALVSTEAALLPDGGALAPFLLRAESGTTPRRATVGFRTARVREVSRCRFA